ncbi:MAG: hypothetical protein DWB44_16835, partial [Chloroflexi bacterium]|nr:hypothetical protein [Chloroflexota bacterium]
MTDGQRAPRNRTLTITGPEIDSLSLRTNRWSARQCVSDVLDTVVCQDIHEASRFLPDEPFVDLLFLDPPYNMEKSFNGRKFGWGQIQIANANRIIIDSSQSRRTWMLNLCDTVLDFYPREIAKIEERI